MFRDDTARAARLAVMIKKAREKKKYSQEDLAELVNVSTETIRKLEQKKTSSPGVFLVADLACVLDLKIQKIVATPRRSS